VQAAASTGFVFLAEEIAMTTPAPGFLRDMRRDPLEVRKATLRSMLAKAGLGLRFNEHLEGDGPTVFAHACKMGLVSKRRDSPYRSGRSPDWLKMKNLAAPAVKRPAGGVCGKMGRRP
jgi:bifunctional non-homologous end joining protein LigD